MVKSIWVSDDESILYTGGSDGTVRLWDIGTRAVVRVFGEGKKRRDSINDLVDEPAYHTDSVMTLQPTVVGGANRGLNMMSAGRDGAICEVDILANDTVKILQHDKPITCIA